DVAKAMMNQISVNTVYDEENQKEIANTSFNPVYMMSSSGSRGNEDQMRQLAGMRGLMAKPSGEILETPITSSFREGLTVLEYFTSTHGARKGLADTALKTANSGYLTRRLVDVVQDVIVSEMDCGTVDGIEIAKQNTPGEVQEGLYNRILGRLLLYDVYHPDTRELIASANTLVDDHLARTIEGAGIHSVTIRSVLTCQCQRGVCACCYGRDLARGHMVNVGEAVGIIAAQSIGEPGTQLTMRTFHIGGTASKEIEQSAINANYDGRIIFNGVSIVENKNGELLVMGKNGQVGVVDEQGQERERYTLPVGAKLYVNQDAQVKQGDLIAEWDPFQEPFLADVSGKVKYTDIVEGKTYQEKMDDTTQMATKTIIEYRSTNFRPSISIQDENGEVLTHPNTSSEAVYYLPVGAILMVLDGDRIEAGDVIARKPRESAKIKDIVGGLPRVAELFEVRKPKEMAVISETEGTVSYGPDVKGKRKVYVTPETGESKEYLVPKGKHITVQEGDYVEAGEFLTEGTPELHDLLRVKGEKYLANYLVEEIQDVYKYQGVHINDKHVEIIVRQMLKKVRITEPGETQFLIGEQVEKQEFLKENSKAIQQGSKPAKAEPIALGITQASLSTDSFISAASFQETTKVLTDAAMQARIDYLQGLKENVIVGRIIPAGTGFRPYMNLESEVPEQPGRESPFWSELEGVDEEEDQE
ncbi:MAG: DNA-directed RNA polymerase subunit beta', partial [Desulfohalobiaceae bacterium]